MWSVLRAAHTAFCKSTSETLCTFFTVGKFALLREKWAIWKVSLRFLALWYCMQNSYRFNFHVPWGCKALGFFINTYCCQSRQIASVLIKTWKLAPFFLTCECFWFTFVSIAFKHSLFNKTGHKGVPLFAHKIVSGSNFVVPRFHPGSNGWSVSEKV